MAVAPFVREPVGFFTATTGVDLIAGDLVYFDGTNWLKADADDNTKYAEAMAINNSSSGEVAGLCTGCILVDNDAPFTQGDQFYLSATAGAITATRPTANGNLRQLCGYSLSTSELRIEIGMVKELPVTYNANPGTAAAGGLQWDTGNYISVTTNADDEDVGFTFAYPENGVGVEIAYLYTGSEVVTGATDYDLAISGARDGEQWDATTEDTVANLTVSGAVADEMQRGDVTAGFNATGVMEADNCIGVKCTHDGAQTDITFVLALHIVYLVV